MPLVGAPGTEREGDLVVAEECEARPGARERRGRLAGAAPAEQEQTLSAPGHEAGVDELDRAVAEPEQEQRLHQAAPRLGRELGRVFHAADHVISTGWRTAISTR